DFVWRAQGLIVETDGLETHRTRQAFERDRRRDQRLVAAGWRVIRVTWRQLLSEAERLAATLQALLHLYRGRLCLQPCQAHQTLAPPKRLGDMPRRAAAEAEHLPGEAAGLLDQRSHSHALETARDDPPERLEVVLDVHREAMCGHATGDVNANRGDLAV